MTQHIRLRVKAVNNKIVAEQERLGFNSKEMAKYLKLCPSTYSSLIHYQFTRKNGQALIGRNLLIRVAGLLGYTIEELFAEHATLFANTLNFSKTEILLDDNKLKLLTEQKDLKLLSEAVSYFDDKDLKLEINRSLATLDPKEADMVKMYYGLDGYKKHTFNEIGIEYKLTKETVRRHIEKSITKLKYPKRSKLLRQYL